jgi:pyridoxamine 5'-phosphate oxidase
MADLARRFEGQDVPLPPNWGGYRLIPDAIEFWLHRDNRLHDRIRYTRRDRRNWVIERLSP